MRAVVDYGDTFPNKPNMEMPAQAHSARVGSKVLTVFTSWIQRFLDHAMSIRSMIVYTCLYM